MNNESANEYYSSLIPSYIEERNGKYLLLWSDLPTWMVVDKELFELMQSLDCKTNIQQLSKKFNKSVKDIQQILNYLRNENVVAKVGDYLPHGKEGTGKIRDVLVHPTNRCNLQCIHCCNRHNWVPKEKEISTELIKDFLNQTLEFTDENPSLSIIGGEPLLEPEKVLEIAQHARNIGFDVIGISTNATLITREFAKRAKELNMEVQVSVDGVTPDENDRIRGKGTFKKILKAIKILKEEGVFVITNYTCTIDNYQSLEKYFNLASSLGVNSARFGPMKRIGAGTDTNIKTLSVNKLLEHAHSILKKHPEYRKLFGKDYFSAFANSCKLNVKFHYCGTGQMTVLLNPDGSIYPCTGHALPEFLVGNIQETSFSELWKYSPILKKIRTTYPVECINDKCSQCIVRYWCMGGCRAEAYHCTGKMNEPAIECENIKKAIIEMIWRMATSPEMVKDGSHRFH